MSKAEELALIGERSIGSRPLRLMPARWSAVLAGFVLASIAGAVGTVPLSAAVVPTPAAAATACSVTQPVDVHYTLATTPTPRAKWFIMVSGVVISNLPGACNGTSVKVVLSGNGAGNPSTSSPSVLSTGTSTIDPCTQQQYVNPPTVNGGSITLALCATPGGQASYVQAHELTKLTLFVAGKQVAITSPSAASSSSNSASSSNGTAGDGSHNVPVATVTSSTSSLAFTGAEIAAMVAAGLLLVLAGLIFLFVSRRRRSRPSDGPAGG